MQSKFFVLNQCLYVTKMLIQCQVQVVTLQELQIHPHFNLYFVINKYITFLIL